MGLTDKISNKADEVKGQAKEKLGEHNGDDQLVAEGQNDQDLAKIKNIGEKIKDKF